MICNSKLMSSFIHHPPPSFKSVTTNAAFQLLPIELNTCHMCCEYRHSSLEGIDMERLLALINKSFDKTLREDYIDSLQGRLHSIYLSEG